MHRGLLSTVTHAKQVIGGSLHRFVDAGIERAKRREPVAPKRQAQDRLWLVTQELPERDVGLAHRRVSLYLVRLPLSR